MKQALNRDLGGNIMNVEQYKNYLVDTEKLNGENIDRDRCTYVWKNLYIPCYSTMEFWEKTEFENNKSRGKNKGKHKGYITFIGDDFEVHISGDALFNFSGKYYDYFKKLIKEDKDYSNEDKQKYLKDLDDCKSMFYSLHNFALMPQTGGMNKYKGARNDRLDAFVFQLHEYYNGLERSVDNNIFSLAQGGGKGEDVRKKNKDRQKDRLKKFLDTIDSVYKYCEYFYLISDKDFIEHLIENGRTIINSGKAVVDYMQLAEKFWSKRHDIINTI